MKTLYLLLVFLLLSNACSPMHSIRYVPERWVRDNDRLPIERPPVSKRYPYFEYLDQQLFFPLERLVNIPVFFEKASAAVGLSTRQEALNTNNFDEVPDSTWFTNRLGRREMSPGEIRRGPCGSRGPDPRGSWTVIAGNTVVGPPGLIIEDHRGQPYLLKFDPPGHLFLATSAEIISNRILYALGYNVPETYLVDFEPGILEVAPEATTLNKKYQVVPYGTEDLEDLFKRVPQVKKGAYRALASKILPGQTLGPFLMQGKRYGDNNDRIPHEHRRELRGYRVFASLLNLKEAGGSNTMDTFIKTGPEQKGYLSHYLLDFDRSLGSEGGDATQTQNETDAADYSGGTKSLLSFGIYSPAKRNFDPGMLSVGNFEAENFDPKNWKADYSNAAFENMTRRDAFWATKILMRLSDEHISAVVQEAGYPLPVVRKYVTATLIARRNKIGTTWLSKTSPLDNFYLDNKKEGTRISFEDLEVRFGLKPETSRVYRYRLRPHQGGGELVSWTQVSTTTLWLPAGVTEKMKKDKPYFLEIQTRDLGQEKFGPPLHLVIQREEVVKLLGLSRS